VVTFSGGFVYDWNDIGDWWREMKNKPRAAIEF
jgi:hypothetical protein